MANDGWKIVKHYTSCGRRLCIEAGSEVVADVCASNPDEDKNAALIVCAPALYASLQEAVSEMCSNYACEPCPHTRKNYTACAKEDGTCFVQRWIKLLARARGEEK